MVLRGFLRSVAILAALLPGAAFAQFAAYNDVVYDAGNGHPALAPRVTTYSIGNGAPGPSGGVLIDKATGASTGVTAVLTQSGGVNWQPSATTGGSDCNVGTDARAVFDPASTVSLMGTVYYGSTGWWVDVTFSGLNPTRTYEFVTTANRNDASYTARITRYTISGADAFANASTPGTVVTNGGASTSFSTGYNTVNGYVACWVEIAPGADGSFKVRAEAGSSEYRAYAFDAFLLAESPPASSIRFTPAQIETVAGSAGVDVSLVIPPGANANRNVNVTLASDAPSVAQPAGAAGNPYVVSFPMGGPAERTLTIEIGTAGSAAITSTNDAGLGNSQLPVVVSAGQVTFSTDLLRASPGTTVPLTVRITPGSNQARSVAVTIGSDDPAVAVPANATDTSATVVFAAGGAAEQTVNVQAVGEGNTLIRTANDGGLADATLPVQVLRLDRIKVVVNPYAQVNWPAYQRHRANMHTHTTQSDGSIAPAQVIDEYKARGYSILAITDHNRCTWPWENWGRYPDVLGMLAIAGNELSDHHHLNSYFINFQTTSTVIEQSLAQIGAAGGISVFNHPGRYNYTVNDYVRWYQTFDHLFGMEVINQGGRYIDVPLWDQVLSVLMPGRPVWGSAADDMHTMDQLGRDWLTYLLPPPQPSAAPAVSGWENRPWMQGFLNDAAPEGSLVRQATVDGQYYFSSLGTHPSAVRSVAQTPVINTITLDDTAGTITIDAASGGQPLAASNYRWVSMGSQVHLGPTINFRTAAGVGSYVRAELIGQGGTTFTNPFGIALVGPTLALSTNSISRSVHIGDSLAPDSFTVANSGPESLSYTIGSNASWLTVDPNAGQSAGEADPVAVHYAVEGLPVGLYHAIVTVASPEAINSPVTLAVTVDVRTVGPDLDHDGDVDPSDFGRFQVCLGTTAAPGPCQDSDFNGSGTTDGSDAAIFLNCLSGAEVLAAADCAP